VAGQEQLAHFLEKPCRRDTLEQFRQHRDGFARCRFRLDAELGHEARRAQQPDRVFPVPGDRVSNQPQATLGEIPETTDEILDVAGYRVQKQGIDGEVAAPRVLLQAAPDVVAQDAAVRVFALAG
jgi:hypothetical protein